MRSSTRTASCSLGCGSGRWRAPGVTWIEFSVPSLAELAAAAEAEGRKLLGDPRLPNPEVEPPPETVALWRQGNPSLGYLFDLGSCSRTAPSPGTAGSSWRAWRRRTTGRIRTTWTISESVFDFEVWKRAAGPVVAAGGSAGAGHRGVAAADRDDLGVRLAGRWPEARRGDLVGPGVGRWRC
jgi:hypothetical protein